MGKNNVYGLYCICENCEGDVKYVGKTTAGAQERLYRHRWNARNGLVYPVYAWMRKHGVDNIKSRVLEDIEDPQRLDELEIRWITELKTLRDESGYNLSPGGGGTFGYKHAPDAKTRISRKASDETRRRISEANRKRVGSLASRATITDEQVAVLKMRMWNGESLAEVSKDTGVPKSTLSGISTGESWGHVPWPIGPRVRKTTGRFTDERKGEQVLTSKLTEDKVRQIRTRYDAGERPEVIARDFGVTRQNVGYIGKRVTWKHVD